MSEGLHNIPMVIDNGSGTIRAGFAGEDLPKCYFPSFVGRPKHLRVLAGALEGNLFIGPRAATDLRGLLKIHYPLEHGIVTDWDEMERIWSYVYEEGLKVLSEEHPVLLTEPPLNPRSNRDMAAQVLFETFNVPAVYMSIQAVLSLYASGRTTGIVLDAGDGVSHAVPVYEGFAVSNSIQRIDVAGRDVTEYLQTLLRKTGYVFHTSAEKEVVRQIKEATTYIAIDPRKEEKEYMTAKTDAKKAEYVLPDGNKLRVGVFPPSLQNSAYACSHTPYPDQTDWRRALPGTRNSVRPRDHRPRVPRPSPDGGRRHRTDRPRLAQVVVCKHCAVGRHDADQGLRRPAAARGPQDCRQGHAHQDLCTTRAQVHHVDWRQHPGWPKHIPQGESWRRDGERSDGHGCSFTTLLGRSCC